MLEVGLSIALPLRSGKLFLIFQGISSGNVPQQVGGFQTAECAACQ